MKTKSSIKLITLLMTALILSFTGCKKDDDSDSNEVTDTKSLQQLSKDEMAVESATDDVLNDANDVLTGNHNKLLLGFPCNVTIDSTNIVNDTITYSITYNGLNCAGTRYRKGNATVKKYIYTHWNQAGATVYVTFINLKITKVSTGQWLILNGTKTFVNVSGGLIVNLGNGVSSVVHRVSGALQATFDDNTTRTWNIARQRTFTGAPGNLMISLDGFGTSGNYSNLTVWGINRNGENFYTQISQTVVLSQQCGWDPQSGQKTHDIPAASKKATLTFGYDANLQLVTAGTCATHYKLDWQKNNNSGTIYLPLP